ncbi:MAG: hypothetical protein MPJ24_10510 [Pirellulaceae bacterium]|nr:hypothetical protein [Pirellulaceae bacterium]
MIPVQNLAIVAQADSIVSRSPLLFALVCVVLIVVIILGVVVVLRFRDSISEGGLSPQEVGIKFKEMAERGDISHEEYRTIKQATKDGFTEEVYTKVDRAEAGLEES